MDSASPREICIPYGPKRNHYSRYGEPQAHIMYKPKCRRLGGKGDLEAG